MAAFSGAKSSVMIAGGTLLSRILGMFKAFAMTAAVGVTLGVSNIFTAANTLPNLIYLLITGGVINQVLVPQIIKASRQKDHGADYVSRLITLFTLLFLTATIIIVACHRGIIELFTDGWTEQQINLGSIFALWSLPQIFFYGMYTILGQTLNAYHSFTAYAWAPVLNNVIALTGIILFIITQGANVSNPHTLDNWTQLQTFLIAGMATVGVIVQATVLLWPLKHLGLSISPRFGWRGIELGHAIKIALWALLTTFVGNFAYLFLMRSASGATGAQEKLYDSGSNEQIAGQMILDNATMVYILPHSVITLSIATILFNQMAAAASKKNTQGVKTVLHQGLTTTGIATIFSTVALIVLSPVLGTLLGGRDVVGSALTAQIIIALAVGLPFYSASFIMNRVFYSYEDARTPFKISLFGNTILVIAALIALLVAPQYIILTIALGITLSNVTSVIVSHHYLTKLYGTYRPQLVLFSIVKMLGAALIAGILGLGLMVLFGLNSPNSWVWSTDYLPALIIIVIVGTAMGIVYFVFLKLFRVQEINSLLRPLTARLSQKKANT